MPRVSTRRRITLPADQCREAGIGPGDEYRSYVADGQITIVRKTAGTAKGLLRHVAGDPTVSDEESLEDALEAHARVGLRSTVATEADKA